MKKPNTLTYVIPVCLVFWLALLFIQGFHIKSLNNISRFAAQIEFVVHIFMLITVFKIYKSTNKENKKIMIWFVIAAIFLFINDMSFYAVTYFKNTLSINVPLIHFLLDLIPFFIWVFTISMFFSIMLGKAISGRKHYLKVLLPLILMDFIIICLFLSAIHYAFSILSAETISQASTFIVQLIVFDFAILCLIYSENIGFSLVLSGFIVLICGDFFLIYSFISQTDTLLVYGELLWLLGLFIILFGVFYLQKMKNYTVSTWVRKSTSIKSKLTIWFFSGSIISFLLLFIIAYLFSMIDKEVFLSLPLFIMLYSVIVITFSAFMGRCFETPFKKLENNIRTLMLEDDMQKLDSSFSTEEFIFLQKFIVEAFEFKEAKDHAQKELGRMTAQVAHDIRSPLAALNTALRDIPEISEQKRILIRNATRRISDIANNLLVKYKIKSDGKEKEFNENLKPELISSLLDSLISEKKIQIIDKTIDLLLEIGDAAHGCFVNLDHNQFKRMISNLINNSVEAIEKNGTIKVCLEKCADQARIEIIDNGKGIPADLLPKIKIGGSSVGKKDGFGLGILGALKNIKDWGGNYDIISKDGKGTTFRIDLPLADEPSWFQRELILFPNMKIFILDDDESIHNVWEMHFKDLLNERKICLTHLYTPNSLIEYCSNYQELKNNLFLVDYELIGFKETGLDIIEKLNINNHAILVTSRYEESEIRERVEKLQLKIIPKNYAPYISIISQDNQPDLIFIDDSQDLTMAWEQKALLVNKNIAAFNSLIDFKRMMSRYDKNIPLYIDSNLGGKIKGEVFAKELFELGFKDIYLATGFDKEKFQEMYWIKKIVSKDPPF